MTDAERYTILNERFIPTDPRLGRHVAHDSRSLKYLEPVVDTATLVNKKWTSAIPTLDQGQIGSCVGNAVTKNVTYGTMWAAIKSMINPNPFSTTDAGIDERYAVRVYSDAETIDGDGPYPPQDHGTSGLSGAKVALSRGLISGYTHANSFDAVCSALQTQAVITGVTWHQDMFNPSSNGEIKPTGAVAGGHEFVLDEIDMDLQRIWMQNSWNSSWGVDGGRAWFAFDAFRTIMADRGDVTVLKALNQPSPVPTPPSPTPTPVPVDAQSTFVAGADVWISHRHTWSVNTKFEEVLKTYLSTL